jgi:hypothetical protein
MVYVLSQFASNDIQRYSSNRIVVAQSTPSRLMDPPQRPERGESIYHNLVSNILFCIKPNPTESNSQMSKKSESAEFRAARRDHAGATFHGDIQHSTTDSSSDTPRRESRSSLKEIISGHIALQLSSPKRLPNTFIVLHKIHWSWW